MSLSKTDEPRPLMRLAKLLLGSVLLLLFIWFGLWSGLFLQFYRSVFPIVYYSESFADITVDGQQYHLTSVAKCSRHFVAPVGGLVSGGSIPEIEGGLLVKRLPSGAGIVLVGPALCWENELERLEKNNNVLELDPSNYLSDPNETDAPKLLWLDDAASPKRIEGFWRGYVPDSSAAKIELNSIGYKEIRAQQLGDPTVEIPFLSGMKHLHGDDCERVSPDWFGVYAMRVPENIWEKRQDLAFLRRLDTTTAVERPGHVNLFSVPVQSLSLDPSKLELRLPAPAQNIGVTEYWPASSFPTRPTFGNLFMLSPENGQKLFPVDAVYSPASRTIFAVAIRYFAKNQLCR